jgi:alpha-amylase
MKTRVYLLTFGIILTMSSGPRALAQSDVMMQAFYWDLPVEAASKNGNWWRTLTRQAAEFRRAGIKAIWTPPPSKGNFGIYDMGYGVFDHFDLGNYSQKGSVETRFGSKEELIQMVRAMHTNGIEVYSDIVLNHIFTNDSEQETNPAVKNYVNSEALVGGAQFRPYPTVEILWRIANAESGDYYIKIKGYGLNWTADRKERAYDIFMRWDDSPEDSAQTTWESEPNNGDGQFNSFPASGHHVWAHIAERGDVDEYKVTLSSIHDLDIRLVARREVNGRLEWASQENGYRVFEVWHTGSNIAPDRLQARTNTGVNFIRHTGRGELNYSWSYWHFHPADLNDYLGGDGVEDSVEPNRKAFGQDFNTFNPMVQDRLIEWGRWLTNAVGFDGYRLDFVRGYQEEFAARWITALPRRPDGTQHFVVAEYWSNHKYRIKEWERKVAGYSHSGRTADVAVFDFPLKSVLTEMTNQSSMSFDMRRLNHAGLARDDSGNRMPARSVVTFVENHDTGKEHDKWVTKDWKMAYAYILFAEGRPCLFYPHYYAVNQRDAADGNRTITAPASLQSDIRKMIRVRRDYLDGGMIVLSEVGNPHPAADAANVYVARRSGNGAKPGAILVVNNHETETKGLWVDNAPQGSGYVNWAGKRLVNVTSGNREQTRVQADGRVYVSAPARGYAVYITQ